MNIDQFLEKFLEFGTWTATLLVGIGVIFQSNMIVMLGTFILILIPVGRVVGLLINYLKQKDYLMSSIATFVLTIILVSFAYGYLSPSLPLH